MLEVAGGGERYKVLRQIGAGGMGVVYEAEDRERGQKVALKTIEYDDIEKIYRLKREFRALADLNHPNLVSLYDLVVADKTCFFTMELLDGVDLLAYVWRRPVDELLALAATTESPPTDQIKQIEHGQSPPRRREGPGPCDLDRLRTVLPQLARGLRALHVAGKIHRDIKPSNVRVTSDGRVVLLDFGLVTEVERGPGIEGVVGTVPYMAPEQCAGDITLTPAADWYALGVILFQALTGRLPFEGSATKILYDKQTQASLRPSQLIAELPQDLDELCAILLERDPAARPDGVNVMRQLGASDADSGRRGMRSREDAFAGRDTELASLDAALAPLDKRRASVAVVRAPSGMGKTTLVERFLERLRASRSEALVLRGRCLDREDVPYKAIDNLIDELSDWWIARSRGEAEALLPRDACLLPTLFPVLDRVPAIADAPRTKKIADPQARRTQAFEALREALQRLADRYTVVLFLDDMQWVDRDTTALLADLMRAPDPPALLLVLATRIDDSDGVLELVQRMDCETSVVDVSPLPSSAATALAMAQLGESDAALVERLVSEADGSPLFLLELTRYLRDHSLEDIAGKGLDAVLAERIAGLGESARTLAEIVAAAGEPVTRRTLAAATNLPNEELTRQLSQLRAERVVRMSGSRADDTTEPYHARVRSAVLAQLPADRRAKLHRTLATALSGRARADQLARHWYAAGDLQHAADHARRAGDEARAKLDFDLSARWYAIALEGTRWTGDERRTLQTDLADAFADAGRPREAADQFLVAAEGADTSTALELRRRAAGSLLQSGYLSEGLAMTRSVLGAVGLSMPKTPMRALFSMLARRAWLRIRGLGFRPRPRSEITQLELTRVDVCEGVAFGLALVDTFRSMDFATRFLHSALRLGEPNRIARALALETDLLAATAKGARAQRLLERLDRITPTLDDQAAVGQLSTTRGFLDFFIHNRFRTAFDLWADAITSYRALVGRAGFELDTVTMFSCWCLYYLGEIGELSRRVPAMAEGAARAGNRYTSVTLRCAFPIAWLVRLSPDEVEAELDAALASWTDTSYQLQHMFALCSRVDLALYRGRPDDVTARLPGELKQIRKALLDRAPMQATLLYTTLARLAVARKDLPELRRYVRAIRRIPVPIARECAVLFEGLAAEIEGNKDDAMAAYRACIPTLARFDTHLFAHAARARLGRLIGGDEGRDLENATETYLRGEGVSDPNAILSMLLPGPSWPRA